MVKKLIPYEVDRKGYHLTLESVPARVCGQCGEPYFDEKEVDEIQNTLKIMDERTGNLAVEP